jgi:uncharacterized small protein (DUF1192 family)
MANNEPTMDDVVAKLGQEGALFTLDEITVLTDEIERMESELQDARYRAEAAEEARQATEADLAEFYECDDSNGCYDDCGRVHIYDTAEFSFSYANHGERPRAVYHKTGE